MMRDRLVELTHAHGCEILAGLGRVGLGIEDVAGLASGAGHEDGVDALAVVAGHRGGALRRLVVGMRVDRKHTHRRSADGLRNIKNNGQTTLPVAGVALDRSSTRCLYF